MKKYNYKGFLFILPSLMGVALFVLLPFADVVRRSFSNHANGGFAGFTNYLVVFKNAAFQLAAVNTLKFSAICIPILIIFSLLMGIFLFGQTRLVNTLKTMYLLPMAVPVASMVLLWRVLFHVNGLLNGLLDRLHISAIDWMNSPAAFWVLVFSYVWKNLGYNIVLWLAGLSGIPEQIYEAARVDGAGEWSIFWKITLPSLQPVLYTITVLSFLNSFKVFREAYLVAGDYPHESMYLLQHLFNNWFREMSFDKLAAAAVSAVAVILVIVLQLRRAWEMKE